jgi:hypothetical protein
MSSRFIDSLDYLADTVVVAPHWEWRIVQIGRAKVSKMLPRYCQPTCPEFRKDVDFNCRQKYECSVFVFDQHLVKQGDRVFTILFGTDSLNPHNGVAWMVGEKYFRKLMGSSRVDQMLEDYLQLVTPPEGGYSLT